GLDARPAPRPAFTSEDFAFMLQARPGAYLWLGQGRGADELPGYPLHHPCYDFDDEVLPLGIACLVSLVEHSIGRSCRSSASTGATEAC
ncbi:MAG TPA: hypothetical protein DDZ67_07940, partial [Xanthomonadaceae bacterium]|nr:hypothetical protein [Xanthomonadaceae bacterium]